MALHNTQCPHCFTTYAISDNQLRVSQGMVRCGTCREPFQVRALKEKNQPPQFDPRKTFIEPPTYDLEQRQAQAKADAETQEFSFADIDIKSTKSTTLSEASIGDNLNSDMSLDIDQDAPTFQSNNINTRSDADSKKVGDQQLVLPIKALESIRQPRSRSKVTNFSKQSQTVTNNKETLIDQVDSLVDHKLINTSGAKLATEEAPKGNHALVPETPFELDRKASTSPFSWLLALPLLLIAAALSAALIYQLWIKQVLMLEKNSFVQKKIAELSIPVTKTLAEYNIVLPVRRNLNKLELVGARTEAHPSRSSTTLLRISIINHAEIEQPLPWLEMSLTDAEGRLVSRRSLSPTDYVYQNATNDLIGARELKKVTIELLSFPKRATGYEVTILNR
ncbi:MAG: putative Zn finger-like uncharacterized protein [Arenicella sp.]|jgi:predicted Zn finger-like uncharacterized protein